LNDQARTGLHELLGEGVNISDAEICNWADQIRRERRETAPWRYVNIPLDAPAYDANRDGNNHRSVVDKIIHFRKILAKRCAPGCDRTGI
jgi:hypothetical protein